jgi:hypothetical protein
MSSPTITNNFSDIPNLIRMAFDYFYNQNKTLCYSTKPVNLSDVDSISSVKRILGIGQIPTFVNSMLNDRLTFVKKVMCPFGYKYILKKNNDPYSVDLTFFIYNSDDANNLSSSQNIGKVFLKLFSEFLTFEMTKHILLQIINVDIPMMNLDDFLVSVPELKPILDVDNKQNKIVSIGITEHFFKMASMLDFLSGLEKVTDEICCNLIFQVLHTLLVIKSKYSSFRHNSLQIKKMDGYLKSGSGTTKYVYDNNEYNVPNIGFVYKMSNFENALIVDVLPNENVDDELRVVDDLYDFCFFLKSMQTITLPTESKKFIEKYTNEKNDNMQLHLRSIIDDDYFSSYRGKNFKIKRNRINIENKISAQQLDYMSKPSFLHKGTRKLPARSQAVDDVPTNETRSGRVEKRSSAVDDEIDQSVLDDFLKTPEGSQPQPMNQMPHSGNVHPVQPTKRRLANALRATNDDIRQSNAAMDRFSNMAHQNTQSSVGYSDGMDITMPQSNYGMDSYAGHSTMANLAGLNMNSQMSMPQMPPQMPMPQMPPQMPMSQMSMPQMSMPQMSMPHMSMPQMQPQYTDLQQQIQQMQMAQMQPQYGSTQPMSQMQMYGGRRGGQEQNEVDLSSVDTETFFFYSTKKGKR